MKTNVGALQPTSVNSNNNLDPFYGFIPITLRPTVAEVKRPFLAPQQPLHQCRKAPDTVEKLRVKMVEF